MARAYIYSDESYYTIIERPRDDDANFPRFHLPVEIPDGLFAAYEAAATAERTLRRFIIDSAGESERNPDYEAEWAAYTAKTYDPAVLDRFDTPVPQAEWAEDAWAAYQDIGEVNT